MTKKRVRLSPGALNAVCHWFLFKCLDNSNISDLFRLAAKYVPLVWSLSTSSEEVHIVSLCGENAPP